MLQALGPNLYLPNVLALDAARLATLGIDGLLLDVDGTLKDHGAQEFPAPVRDWVAQLLASGIRLCIVSNGKPRRIEGLAARLGIPFVAQAFKPLPRGCRQALAILGMDSSRVAMVGDQIFADVLAGRLAGMVTILVPPTNPVEPWFTRLKRPIERLVLRWLSLRPERAVEPIAAAVCAPALAQAR